MTKLRLGISFFNIHLLILFCKNVFYFLLYLIFSGSAKSSRANNGITFYYTFTPAGLFRPGFFYVLSLGWEGFGFRRVRGSFRRHSRHGAKAGFKMQRLSQGLGAVLPDKPALGLNFDLKFNKPTWG